MLLEKQLSPSVHRKDCPAKVLCITSNVMSISDHEIDANGSAGSGWCPCRSLLVQIKAYSSWGRAPASPSSLPGLHPRGIWATKEEALHKALLGVQVFRPCHGLAPKWKLLEHQIPFPPVCFCWASADIAIKFHIPSTKFRIFLQLQSWDWTFWKYLWSMILRNMVRMLWKHTSFMASHTTGVLPTNEGGAYTGR